MNASYILAIVIAISSFLHCVKLGSFTETLGLLSFIACVGDPSLPHTVRAWMACLSGL